MDAGPGILYVVSTPIGNLGDMTPRAVEVLSTVDMIAAEDTRTAAMLLQHFGIEGVRMIPNHKFNEKESAGRIVSEILSGSSAALVTDAGTPCISDPGFILVREVTEAGIRVSPVPGCCAAAAAIAVSGFNALSFVFRGFLPRSAGEIRRVFSESVKGGGSPLSVYYESPNRIRRTMEVLAEELPSARVCLCNDMTKKFERIYRGTPAEVSAELESNPNAGKGEYVLLVDAPEAAESGGEKSFAPEGWIADRAAANGCSLREAVSALADDPDCPYTKKELYNAALRMKKMLSASDGE
ncbi:MAG: 16S rRNA (cytidine(1402)-2'-O)-methyltransferase [Clostridia bacterium]|nr:16S rRNA (cytidine(1402)-2'-O)-methyltransferase [Clostridia bacterium]